MLSNGKCGLIDIDINQQQKAQSVYAYPMIGVDYGGIWIEGVPREGQTLDEVKALTLAEIDKLRKGDFDESIIDATIANHKRRIMQRLDSNTGRAQAYVESFIGGTDWADEVARIDRLSRITKADVVAWAQKTLGDGNYAVLYKLQGEDPDQKKIEKPQITPIATNRDAQSVFLTEIQNTEVKPIEPVFVDYKKDMSQFEARKGIDVLYKKNESNDIFTLTYVFDTGTENDPALNLAFDYLGYLGSESLTAEQIASKMYGIACSFSMQAGPTSCRISITGLGENMAEAMEIVEGLLNKPKPDEAILANLKADMIKSRADAKLNQSRCFGALRTYVFYGPDFIRRTTLTNPALEAMSSEMLLAKIGELMGKQHEVLYYGPQSEKEVTEALAMHHKTSAELQPLDKKHLQLLPTDESKVLMAQYDAKQLYYLQYANLGKQFDVAADPEITLYNEYFGGGMNSVVFQEMREARGLAYTAQASIMQPNYADTKYGYMAFIATQNDKMQMAIEAFDEIINNMPESETAFKIAKEGLISRLRTDRTVKEQVLWSFIRLRNLGLEEDRDKQIFEKVQAMTLADVKAAQEKWVKNRKYVYGILGDIQDLDLNYLKTLGPIRTVSQEEIFGY